ncbi:MAG: flagellar export protein FliJ [Cellvibrionaceae bacterium]|nr:flagellar export protein FliJ [Cellvibrionaceae bacterium]
MIAQQLQMVRDQEEKQYQRLGRQLADAQSQVAGEQQQLAQLTHYQQEYLAKINRQQQTWTATTLTHYRSFCCQLDSLITEQQSKLQQSTDKQQQLRDKLYQQQKKLNTLNDMIDREQLAALSRQAVKQQKAMDELAIRRYY